MPPITIRRRKDFPNGTQDWEVWAPHWRPEHYDHGDCSHDPCEDVTLVELVAEAPVLDQYGSTFWSTHAEACEFVDQIAAALLQEWTDHPPGPDHPTYGDKTLRFTFHDEAHEYFYEQLQRETEKHTCVEINGHPVPVRLDHIEGDIFEPGSTLHGLRWDPAANDYAIPVDFALHDENDGTCLITHLHVI